MKTKNPIERYVNTDANGIKSVTEFVRDIFAPPYPVMPLGSMCEAIGCQELAFRMADVGSHGNIRYLCRAHLLAITSPEHQPRGTDA